MALQVQLRFAQKVLARRSSEIASSARPNFRRALARSSSVFATSDGTPQCPLSNRQGSTVQRFRFLRLPLDHAQLGQIHDTQRHVRMVEAQQFLFDGQSPRSKGSTLAILAVHAMDDPQVVERGGDIGVKLAMHGLANLQPLQIHWFRFHILPLAGIDLRQL